MLINTMRIMKPLEIDPDSSSDEEEGWETTSETRHTDLEHLLEDTSDDDMAGLLPAESRAMAELGGKRRRALRRMADSDADDDDEEQCSTKVRFWIYFGLWLSLMYMLRGSWDRHHSIRTGKVTSPSADLSYIDILPEDTTNIIPATISSPNDNNNTTSLHHIQRIAILGERHSGTQWLHSKITECFPSLSVTSYLHRPNHWFQTDPSAAGPIPTLVLYATLNPYHWVNAMRLAPQYAPDHERLEWHEFVMKEWRPTGGRPGDDVRKESGDLCQFDFGYDEVIPCEIDYRRAALYEMRKEGKPYSSIIKLRTAKIENVLSLTDWPSVDAVVTVPYEDLTRGDGLANLLLKMEAWGLVPGCEALFLGKKREYTAEPILGEKVTSEEYVNWMNRHMNWEWEGRLGYHMWTEMPDYAPTASPTGNPDGGVTKGVSEERPYEFDDDGEDDDDDATAYGNLPVGDGNGRPMDYEFDDVAPNDDDDDDDTAYGNGPSNKSGGLSDEDDYDGDSSGVGVSEEQNKKVHTVDEEKTFEFDDVFDDDDDDEDMAAADEKIVFEEITAADKEETFDFDDVNDDNNDDGDDTVFEETTTPDKEETFDFDDVNDDNDDDGDDRAFIYTFTEGKSEEKTFDFDDVNDDDDDGISKYGNGVGLSEDDDDIRKSSTVNPLGDDDDADTQFQRQDFDDFTIPDEFINKMFDDHKTLDNDDEPQHRHKNIKDHPN